MVENKYTLERTVPVPCGKCPECKSRRVSGWSFRLMQQDKQAETSLFVTFTYDTRHVPITQKGFMSLRKKDMQLFFKKLRKKNPYKIKYYYCGEYGGKTNRPHYHAVIFNALYEHIESSWELGETHYGTVTGASVGYVLKYMTKEPRIPMHENDDRVKEYSNMSKGLGLSYLTPAMVAWHKANLNERVYINIEGGKKIPMPRYIKQKLYSEDELSDIAANNQIKQKEKGNELQEKLIELHGSEWERIFQQIQAAKLKKMYSNAEKGRTI